MPTVNKGLLILSPHCHINHLPLMINLPFDLATADIYNIILIIRPSRAIRNLRSDIYRDLHENRAHIPGFTHSQRLTCLYCSVLTDGSILQTLYFQFTTYSAANIRNHLLPLAFLLRIINPPIQPITRKYRC